MRLPSSHPPAPAAAHFMPNRRVEKARAVLSDQLQSSLVREQGANHGNVLGAENSRCGSNPSSVILDVCPAPLGKLTSEAKQRLSSSANRIRGRPAYPGTFTVSIPCLCHALRVSNKTSRDTTETRKSRYDSSSSRIMLLTLCESPFRERDALPRRR